MAKNKNSATIEKEIIEPEDFNFLDPDERKFAIIMGIINIIIGAIFLFTPVFITISLQIFLGFLLIIIGIANTISAFWKKGVDIALGIILGILTIFLGLFIFRNPFQSLAIITFMLSIYFLIAGAFRIFESFSARPAKGWGWTLFNGIVTSILGFFILLYWPISSLVTVGVLIGINFLVFGTVGIMLGITSKQTTPDKT